MLSVLVCCPLSICYIVTTEAELDDSILIGSNVEWFDHWHTCIVILESKCGKTTSFIDTKLQIHK